MRTTRHLCFLRRICQHNKCRICQHNKCRICQDNQCRTCQHNKCRICQNNKCRICQHNKCRICHHNECHICQHNQCCEALVRVSNLQSIMAKILHHLRCRSCCRTDFDLESGDTSIYLLGPMLTLSVPSSLILCDASDSDF